MAKCIKCSNEKPPHFTCQKCGEASCRDCWSAASGPMGGMYCPNCKATKSGSIWDLPKR